MQHLIRSLRTAINCAMATITYAIALSALTLSGCSSFETEEILEAFPDGSPKTIVSYSGSKDISNIRRFTTLNIHADTLTSVEMSNGFLDGNVQFCDVRHAIEGSNLVEYCKGDKFVSKFSQGYLLSAKTVEEGGEIVRTFDLANSGEVSPRYIRTEDTMEPDIYLMAKEEASYLPQDAMTMDRFMDRMEQHRNSASGVMTSMIWIVADIYDDSPY